MHCTKWACIVKANYSHECHIIRDFVPTPTPVTNHAKKGSNKKKRKRKLGTGTGPDPQGLESSSKASSVCGGRASKTGSKVHFL